MKAKNLLVVFAILGIVALGGGFAYGLLTKEEPEKKDSTADSIVPEDEEVLEKDTVPEPEAKDEEVPETKPETEIKENGENNEEEAASVVEEGLVAYYPFNKDTKDYSEEGNDGTNYGAVFVEGKNGKALSFDGKDNFVYAPVNINPIPMPQMTMAAWVKTEDDTKIRKAICHDNSGYDRCIGIDNRQGGEGWSCFAGDGKILGYDAITIDKWTFIAAVYDQMAGTVKLFVDGSTYEKKAKLVGGGNEFILIGANGSTTLQREYFMGAIDEVRIYDYALSEKELNSLYTTGIARPEAD